jgi:hypothetical protein
MRYVKWDLSGGKEDNLAAFVELNTIGQKVLDEGSEQLIGIMKLQGLNYPNKFGTQSWADPIILADDSVLMPVPPFLQSADVDFSHPLVVELFSLVEHDPPTIVEVADLKPLLPVTQKEVAIVKENEL